MTDIQAAEVASSVTASTQTSAPYSNPWWRPAMRDVLAVLSTTLVAMAYLLPWFATGPRLAGALQQVGQLNGAILLQWGVVMGYYFGTSKGAAQRDAAVNVALTNKDGH